MQIRERESSSPPAQDDLGARGRVVIGPFTMIVSREMNGAYLTCRS
jgi:hypothetical protein